jgi:hypothetical protein
MNALTEGIGIIALTLLVTLLILVAIRRSTWLHEHLREGNHVTGLCVNVLGTLNAVILAFILFAVWNRFEQAKTNAEQEASEAILSYRIANGLSDSDRAAVQRILRSYVGLAVTEEWPRLASQRVGPQTRQAVDRLWQTLGHVQPRSPGEQIALDQLYTHCGTMTAKRSERLVMSESHTPTALWVVMSAGGVLTVFAACTYWVERFPMHLFGVAVLSGMIALVLITTKLIDNPFQGDVSIKPEALAHAVEYFDSQTQAVRFLAGSPRSLEK